MNNIYHSDIYQFNTPVNSYWEDASSENLEIDSLKKDMAEIKKLLKGMASK